MQGKHLFEYAIIRIVPRVEREEFLNIGIILYCKDRKYLGTRFSLNKQRIAALCAEVDCNEVDEHLQSFEKIARGDKESGGIAVLDLPSRFRWLTATRSTIIQTSKVHPGFTEDPQATLEKLYAELVL